MDTEAAADTANRRPHLVTILTLGVLTVAVWFLARAVQAVQLWELNHELALSVSPWYLLISGVLLGAAGLVSVWQLWTGRALATRSTGFFGLAVASAYWLDRYWLSVSETRQVNSVFAAAATISILILVMIILRLPGVRRYFQAQEIYEHFRSI